METLSAIRLVWLSGHKYPDASQPLVPPLVFFWGHLLQTDLWQWKHYLTLLLRIFNLVPCLDLTFIVHVNCWISTPNLSYFIYCYTISLPLKVLHFVIKTHSRAFSGTYLEATKKSSILISGVTKCCHLVLFTVQKGKQGNRHIVGLEMNNNLNSFQGFHQNVPPCQQCQHCTVTKKWH